MVVGRLEYSLVRIIAEQQRWRASFSRLARNGDNGGCAVDNGLVVMSGPGTSIARSDKTRGFTRLAPFHPQG